eukprot:366239-Chlamydomonas_euryale.AAC.46
MLAQKPVGQGLPTAPDAPAPRSADEAAAASGAAARLAAPSGAAQSVHLALAAARAAQHRLVEAHEGYVVSLIRRLTTHSATFRLDEGGRDMLLAGIQGLLTAAYSALYVLGSGLLWRCEGHACVLDGWVGAKRSQQQEGEAARKGLATR